MFIIAYIDYGSLLRVNGEFINKNGDLFMDCSDTGYVCDKATYFDEYQNKETEIYIAGDYYVYAGDKNFMLCFYKGLMRIISNNKQICSRLNMPFASETIYLDGFPTIHVHHLDKNIYIEPVESIGTWKDWVKENWIGATGEEKLSELENGVKSFRVFLRALKRNARDRKNPKRWDRYRTGRWLATWEYNEKKYEVIFGYGIDPDEETWERIKFDNENGGYGFTDIEREIIDSWFGAKE